MAENETPVSGAEIVDQMLDLPMVEWQAFTRTNARTNPEAIQHAIRRLDSSIEKMARLRGYLDTSFNGGGYRTPLNHVRAVKDSNSLATKIRRALGYSIPNQDVSF